MIVGAALTETFEHWLLPSPGLVPRGSKAIGEEELQRIEATSAALRHWDDRWRLGIRRKAVLGQLAEVSEIAEEVRSPTDQARLFLVMGELSKISGAMAYDEGEHSAAQKYYTLSLRAFHQAGPEHRLYGVGVLADLARQMLDLQRPQEALELSRIALDSAQAHETPPSVLSMLRTREGWCYAQMGRAKSYHRSVSQAEELIGSGNGRDVPEWACGFDHAELAGVVGARYRDLAAIEKDPSIRRKQAERSAGYISRALELRPSSKVRNRAFDLIGLGRTYLVLGEPVEAARVVGEAASLESRLGSGRVRRRLGDWYAEAAAYNRTSSVAQLREQVSHTLLRESSNTEERA
ncbi:hypothetical protein GCM10022402_27780 [Salinactinospora qingdaonensis]|uniref:Tetratricopeptide repeat-containing protein n=1 Tax=Salinactinospora qingdaonensis TaxID=702744 RepID=A0ABP7FY50_9ACTN